MTASSSSIGPVTPTTAVVTGAAGGIGRAIVSALLNHGFHVAAADVAAGPLEDIPDRDGRLRRIVLDVSSRADVEDAAARLADEPGGVYVLVNNAGVFCKAPLLRLEERATRHTLEVNLLGTLWCMSAFATHMARNRAGRIINIASIAAVTGAALST